MKSAWYREVGSHSPELMTPDQVSHSFVDLSEGRHLKGPTEYFEQTIATVASDVDQKAGSADFTTALAEAKNNIDGIYEDYEQGVNAGRFPVDDISYDTHERIYSRVAEITYPRVKRSDFNPYHKRHKVSPSTKRYRFDELELVLGADVGDDLKTIAMMTQFRGTASSAIKSIGDQQRQIIPFSSAPEVLFTRLYSVGVQGARRTNGISSYFGFYEDLSRDINAQTVKLFADRAAEAKMIVGCFTFLRNPKGSSKISAVQIRDHKVELLGLMEDEKIEAARQYLLDMYASNPEIFTEVAAKALCSK